MTVLVWTLLLTPPAETDEEEDEEKDEKPATG